MARRWPVLESSAVFAMVIRAGISRDHWCLFRLQSEESIKPDMFYDRKNSLPFDLDLQQDGLAIITPQGAKKRGWDDEEVNPKQVETWIRDAIAEEPTVYVTGMLRRLEDSHGKLPNQAVLDAIDTLVREDRLVSYEGNPEQTEKPETLRHGANAMLHKVRPDDAIITPAEAARRGWVTVQSKGFELQGKAAAERLVPLLPRIGTFYGRGAKSAMTVLDIAGLEIRGGGQLRLTLQGALPEAMKQLGELFEVLNHVVTPGDQTQGLLRIDDPDANCPFLQALKKE